MSVALPEPAAAAAPFALFRRHGLDVNHSPDGVRAPLWGDTEARIAQGMRAMQQTSATVQGAGDGA